MAVDAEDERVIEIEPREHEVGSRPLPKSVPVIVALCAGVLIGIGGTDVHARVTRQPPAPAPRMHTVVVTEDGISETFTMPTGSVVSTTAVTNSCSITVDGRFVYVINRVVGNAECGATVR